MEVSREVYISTFNKLPEAVRSYLIDNKLDAVTQKLGQKYTLHVDVLGKLNTSASHMLMGLQSPAEMLGELIMAGVDADTAKKILADLNDQVFVPLREQMRKGSDAAESESIPPAPEAIPATPQIPTPAPATSVPHVQSPQPVPTPAPQQPRTVPPVEPVHERMRTMATDMQAVKEHRAPEPIPYEKPTPVHVEPSETPRPLAASPAPIPPVVIAPPIPPRPNVASSLPQPVTPAAYEPPPVQKIVPPPANIPQTPQPNQYPVDPYREPLD